MNKLETVFQKYLLSGGAPFEGVRFHASVETGCAAILSRLSGNFELIRRVFRANATVHWGDRFAPLIGAEFAKW